MFIEKLELIINDSLKKLGIGSHNILNIEIPTEKKYGDYSCNIAMKLARELKKSPLDIANEIIGNITKEDFIEKIEVVNPGFINFFLDKDIFSKYILESIVKSDLKLESDNSGKKVIIEHTSVNPNKAMHIGHFRNAILGDCIARLYTNLGYNVEVHNYIDDTGVQVADTTNAIINLKREKPVNQDFDDFSWDIYSEINRLYETDPTLQEKRKEISSLIEEGNNEVAKKAKEIAESNLECHLNIMSKLDIYYDLLVYESDIIKLNIWEAAFEKLKESENFYKQTEGEQEGCWVLKSSKKGVKDKILIRKDGTKVYTAKDIAYHMWKFGLLNKDFLFSKWTRNVFPKELWKTDSEGVENKKFGHADRVITLVDERQSYPMQMVKEALLTLGFESQAQMYNHVAYGVVNMSKDTAKSLGVDTTDDKNFYAMSGRKGIGVKAKDLLLLLNSEVKKNAKDNYVKTEETVNAIAVGALKHYMLKYNPLSAIIFDYNTALSLTGNTGPYLQYSYTRASSILKKAGEFSFSYEKKEEINESEFNMIKLLSEWNDIKDEVMKNLTISLISEYAFNLSAAFHSFYEANPVLKSEDSIKDFRLTLTYSYKATLNEVLEILGIKALDIM